MVTWAINVNTDPGCGRIKIPDMAPGSSLAQTSPWPQGASRPLDQSALHGLRFFSSTARELVCFTLSQFSSTYLLIKMAPALWCQAGLWMPSASLNGENPDWVSFTCLVQVVLGEPVKSILKLLRRFLG